MFSSSLYGSVSSGEVGLCQSKDKIALKETQDQLQKRRKAAGEKLKTFNKKHDAVKSALEARSKAKTEKERNAIKIPEGVATLLHRIEFAREKIEEDYFKAKNVRKKLTELQLSMEESYRQAQLAANLTFDSMEDLLTFFDASSFASLQLPLYNDASSFIALDLDGKKADLTSELEKLERGKKDLAVKFQDLKVKEDPSFSYIRLRAGIQGEPNFNSAILALDGDAGNLKFSYEQELTKANTLKSQYMRSQAAMKELTSPTPDDINSLKTLGQSLQDKIIVVGKAHFAWQLKRKESLELSNMEKSFTCEKELKSINYKIEAIENNFDLLLELNTLVQSYKGLKDEHYTYSNDVRAIKFKLQKIKSDIEQSYKKEDLLESKLKKFVDSELRERERVKQAEAAADSSFVKTVSKWMGKKLKWLIATIKELPSVVSALAFLGFSTAGYYLEIAKELVMFVVGVAADIVFATVPLAGMAFGFALSQADAYLSNPVAPKAPKNPSIVLSVSKEASKYYFLSSDGKTDTSSEMISMVDSYMEFLSAVEYGHKKALDEERVRAEKLVNLSKRYDEKIVDLDALLVVVKDKQVKIKEAYHNIAQAEKKQLPLRKVAEELIEYRVSLYNLLEEIDTVQSKAHLSMLTAKESALRRQINESIDRALVLSTNASVVEGKNLKNASEKIIVKFNKELSKSALEIFEIELVLQNISLEIDYLNSVNAGPFQKPSKDTLTVGGIKIERPSFLSLTWILQMPQKEIVLPVHLPVQLKA